MKKIKLVLISLLLISCSTVKTEQTIIQDFIKERNIKNIVDTKPTYLIEEASPRKKALEYYELAYLDRKFPDGKIARVSFSPYKTIKWSIDSLEIDTLKSLYKNDTISYHWKESDFNRLDLPIIKYKELRIKMYLSKFPDNITGYMFSVPILSLNKKYALFSFNDFNNLPKTDNGEDTVCLMEKIKDKWIIKTFFSIDN